MEPDWARAQEATVDQEVNESPDPATPRMQIQHHHAFRDIVKHSPKPTHGLLVKSALLPTVRKSLLHPAAIFLLPSTYNFSPMASTVPPQEPACAMISVCTAAVDWMSKLALRYHWVNGITTPTTTMLAVSGPGRGPPMVVEGSACLDSRRTLDQGKVIKNGCCHSYPSGSVPGSKRLTNPSSLSAALIDTLWERISSSPLWFWGS